MAEGRALAQDSPTRQKSWYRSASLRDNQSPTCSSSLSDYSDWYHKASSCTLKHENSSAQGIITLVVSEVIAGLLGASNPVFVLLTNHHVIPSKGDVNKWGFIMGNRSNQLSFRLKEDLFERCFSCCGPDGAWSRDSHERKSCPFGGDFTLLVLSDKFYKLIVKKEFIFPSISSMSSDAIKEAFTSDRFSVFNRDESSGVVRENDLKMKARGSPTDGNSIESQIATYKSMCLLRYNYEHDVCSGTSGAGICCKSDTNERTILGLHVCHEEKKTEQYGITVYSMLCSIEGGDTIISCISQLKDVLTYGTKPLSLQHTEIAKKWYKHLQSYLESRNGAQEPLADDGFILQLLNYLLYSEYIYFDIDHPLTLSSLDLLAEVLNVLTLNTGTRVSAIIKEFERGEETLQVKIKEASKQLMSLIKIADNKGSNEPVLKACFECYSKIMKFPFAFEDHPYQNVVNLSTLKSLRDSPAYSKCPEIHRYFGDICISYQAFLKDKFHREAEDLEKKLVHQANEEIGELNHMLEEKLVEELKGQRDELEQELAEELKRQRDELEQELAEELKRQRDKLEQELAEELKRQQDELEQELVNSKLAIHELQSDNSTLNVENEKLSRKLASSNGVLRSTELASSNGVLKSTELASSNGVLKSTSQSSISDNYPIPRTLSGSYHSNSESNTIIWGRDMREIIQDVTFRERIAKFLKKTSSSKSSRTWEHLIQKLDLKMDVEDLEETDVANILKDIINEWSKITRVSASMFCDECDQMGITRIREEFVAAQENFDSTSYPMLGSVVSNSSPVEI